MDFTIHLAKKKRGQWRSNCRLQPPGWSATGLGKAVHRPAQMCWVGLRAPATRSGLRSIYATRPLHAAARCPPRRDFHEEVKQAPTPKSAPTLSPGTGPSKGLAGVWSDLLTNAGKRAKQTRPFPEHFPPRHHFCSLLSRSPFRDNPPNPTIPSSHHFAAPQPLTRHLIHLLLYNTNIATPPPKCLSSPSSGSM
jgi:hypothetical protein